MSPKRDLYTKVEGKVSLEQEVFPKLIGKRFYGVPFKGYFIDIGIPEDYKRLLENPDILENVYQ